MGLTETMGDRARAMAWAFGAQDVPTLALGQWRIQTHETENA